MTKHEITVLKEYMGAVAELTAAPTPRAERRHEKAVAALDALATDAYVSTEPDYGEDVLGERPPKG